MINKCRICNSDNIKIVRKVKSTYFNYEYSLYHCNSCLSRSFDPNEHKNVSLENLYEGFAKEITNKVLSVKFIKNRKWQNEVDYINKISSKKIESVLDIGCRTGDFLMHFDDSILKYGVELSKQYSDICSERKINIYTDFIENINFDRKFDLVTAYALLEHLEFPKLVLKNMKNLVTNEGVIVVLVPWHQCLKEKIVHRLGIQWHMFTPPEHLNYFSREFLIDYFTQNNEYELVSQKIGSGGLINPFRKIPFLRQAFSFFMQIIDNSFLNQFSIFDHLYLYFKKVK